MTYIIVNYLSPQSPFETWDVREEKVLKRKTTPFEKLLKVISIVSYIPTTVSILRYFFSLRK